MTSGSEEKPINALRQDDFNLAGLEIAPQSCSLSYGQRKLKLEPRVMQVLLALVDQQQQVVDREEIMVSIWGHEYVTDDALTRCISQLRKSLQELQVDHLKIETLPKQGYRLDISDHASHKSRYTGVVVVAVLLLAVTLYIFRDQLPGISSLDNPSEPSSDSSGTLDTVETQTATSRWVPVTSLPGREIDPDLSPNGNQVVFSWASAPLEQDKDADRDLYVTTLGTDSRMQLTDSIGRDRYPRWSPDGRMIAYINVSSGHCQVMQVSPTGGSPRLLTDCDPDADLSLAWTPDSSRLVYAPPQTAGPKGLGVIHLETGEVYSFDRPAPGELTDAHPTVSPDGEWVAFTRWRAPGVADVYRVPVTGGEIEQVTFDSLKVHGLTWSEDSQRIVFASNRGGNYGLWAVPANGGAPQLLPVPGRSLDSPVMSADGDHLVVEEWTDQSNIWVRSPADSYAQPSPLISSTRWDWSPSLSPDEDRIAFVSDRSGAAEIWVSDAQGNNALRLTGFDGPFTNGPDWSPDGQWIIFESPVDGNFDIYRVNAQGGTVQRLTTHEAVDRGASWSRDGGSIYFGSNRSGDWQVWKMTLEDGSLQQVTDAGGYLARESADGEWLYFSRTEEAGLWRMPVAGGAVQEVVNDLTPMDSNNWYLKDDMLYYVSRGEGLSNPELVRVNLVTEQRDTMTPLRNLKYKSGFSVNAQGQVIYSKVDESESDLMVYYFNHQN